jgi:hypothetical protein
MHLQHLFNIHSGQASSTLDFELVHFCSAPYGRRRRPGMMGECIGNLAQVSELLLFYYYLFLLLLCIYIYVIYRICSDDDDISYYFIHVILHESLPHSTQLLSIDRTRIGAMEPIEVSPELVRPH